jgi:hypothetical protein
MRWIQSRVGELSLYPLADNGIVLAALASHSGPHRRRGALSYPHVDDVAKFKDPEQDRQQDKGNGQDRLKRFLPSLSRQTSVSQCVWVSFWTMSFIFDTRPVFHIITPTTRVPKITAAPITHSRVDCPNRTLLFMMSSSPNPLPKRASNDPPEERDHDQYHELWQVDRCQDSHQFRADA